MQQNCYAAVAAVTHACWLHLRRGADSSLAQLLQMHIAVQPLSWIWAHLEGILFIARLIPSMPVWTMTTDF